MTQPSTTEKHGGAHWARCPGCASWVHVSEAILEAGTIDLYCPSCEKRFPPSEAPEIV
jgi:hypothetical protein